MYNKAILIGNLGRDPEVRSLDSGAKVATFSIATNENYQDKSGEWQTVTQWHNIVCWRYLADRVEKDLVKGSLVFVEGKITNRKYQDSEGKDKYISEVVAAIVKKLEKREGGGNYPNNFPSAGDELPGRSMQQPPSSTMESTPAKDSAAKDYSDVKDDDLPF